MTQGSPSKRTFRPPFHSLVEYVVISRPLCGAAALRAACLVKGAHDTPAGNTRAGEPGHRLVATGAVGSRHRPPRTVRGPGPGSIAAAGRAGRNPRLPVARAANLPRPDAP